jgi:hypothetical protein
MIDKRTVNELSRRPRKGDRYRHPRLRGVWTVQSAGAKFVTVQSSIVPCRSERIPTEGFMRADWERA